MGKRADFMTVGNLRLQNPRGEIIARMQAPIFQLCLEIVEHLPIGATRRLDIDWANFDEFIDPSSEPVRI